MTPRFLHRFMSGARALSVIERRVLYLAPPASLNDPFEFGGSVDFECSVDDRKTILDLAARDELGLTEEEIRQSEQRLDEMARTEFYVYLLSLKLRALLKYFFEFSGICCFTAHDDHPLLWAHYADGHRGACLVFNNLDGLCPIFDRPLPPMPVVYSDEVPQVRVFDFYVNREKFWEDVFQLFATKKKAWSYEQEWRVVVPSTRHLNEEQRLLRFEEQHMCKVVLGHRIDPAVRDAIRQKEARRRFPLLIYQAKISDSDAGLAFKLIPPGFEYSSHADWHELPGPETKSPFPLFLVDSAPNSTAPADQKAPLPGR
jgi:hypothetical protein